MNNSQKKGQSVPQKPLTDAQRELVINNIPFAKNIARKYICLGAKRGITLLELETESCSALCEAAISFSSDMGIEFQTYAYQWCKKYVMMCISDWGYPSMEDVDCLADDIMEDDDDLQEQIRQQVASMMTVLNAQEAKVIRMMFGFDGDTLDFAEVATALHLHTGRVHEIYERAMSKMEQPL